MSSLDYLVRDVFADLKQAPQPPVHRADATTPIVYLMRGLPSCGKSFTARQLAGKSGIVVETDEYFVTQVGHRDSYDFDRDSLDDAREWNLARFRQAIERRESPIVVDRGNGRNAESKCYLEIALQHDYAVELAEPNSPWWREIKTLLRYRPHTQAILDEWAKHLAEFSRETHNVPASTISSWMDSWWDDLTIDDILAVDSTVEV